MLAVLAAAGGLADQAASQVVQVVGMPDFDQRRANLASDGASHCVPTACINMMAYIANNGLPVMMNGPRNWQSQAQHDFVSGNIFIMGGLMGTTGTGGTGGAGAETGLRQWVDDHAPGLFTVTRLAVTSGEHAVTPQTLFDALSGGSLVSFFYGRYRRPFKFEPPYERTGGHAVTLTLVSLSTTPGLNPTVQYRDPATDDGNLNMQSTFSTRTAVLTQETITLTDGTSRTMWELNLDPPPPLSTLRFMDTIHIVNPTFVLATSAAVATIHRPLRLTGSPAPMTRNLPPPLGQTQILRAGITPCTRNAVVVTNAGTGTPTRLWHLSLQAGAYDELMSLAATDTPVAISRHTGEYYIPDAGGSLVRYETVLTPGGDITLSPLQSHGPGSPIGAVAYDDETDEVLALLSDVQQMLFYPRTLDEPMVVPMMGMFTLASPMSVHVGPPGSPVAGKYFVQARRTVYQFRHTGDSLELEATFTPSAGAITGISMTDTGTFLIIINSQIVEYWTDPEAGSWAPRPDSVFTGLAATRTVSVSRSRSNYDPALHNIPGWEQIIDEIDVPEIPDCAADFNHDGLANSQDFFDFLAAFFAQEPAADFNLDAAINSQDFFDFLAAFFAGCS
jgi:hypothetical protein